MRIKLMKWKNIERRPSLKSLELGFCFAQTFSVSAIAPAFRTTFIAIVAFEFLFSLWSLVMLIALFLSWADVWVCVRFILYVRVLFSVIFV